ncbi:COG4223 family protein [Paracoccus aerius]
MAARIQTLADQAGALEQQIQTAAQAAQAQINAAQAEAQQLQEAAAESTRRAEAVAAVAALQSALDQGVNPDEARQTLEGAGLQAPEALTREVPSLDSLQADFPEAARAALRTSLRQDSAAGNGNLLTNFLRAQTGARSVEAREGSDPDAILSRADGAVEEGRIADALTEIEALPEEAKAAPAMADWLAGATAYRDAQAALSDLSAPSN